jgi:hypothetical protein
MKWLIVLLLALPLAAQEQKAPENPNPLEHKLFVLKYADPGKLQQLLGMLGAQSAFNAELHAVSITARAADMPAIEEAIKRLDVPPPAPQNIELTAYYLVGNDAEATGGVPKDLDSVVVQLKNTFPFKTYHLLDTMTLRMRSGSESQANSAAEPPGSRAIFTNLRIGSASVSADGSTVRINRLNAGMRTPVPASPSESNFNYQDLGLNADIDIKEGQKVVVGRLSMGKDQALFLVLTARVVN